VKQNNFPFPCLLADVGGTNARFASIEKHDAPVSATLRLETGTSDDFSETVEKAIFQGQFPRPRSFLLAAAGAVEGRRLTLSNAATLRGLLIVDGPELCRRLQLEQGILLNDFEALSLALPFIPEDGLLAIGGGVAVPKTPQIVIGAGTGLGVGALLKHEARFIPLASEGGHTAVGPESGADFALWPHLGAGRISGDDVLSGRGLTRLYRALAQNAGVAMQDETPAAISLRALEGSESLAVQTVDLFLAYLGRFAGDMALTFGARNGVFIAGGIAPRFASRILQSPFRKAFEAKDMHQTIMQSIPTWLITAADPTMIGLAELARYPAKFSLDFADRNWSSNTSL
jgi:glucokinase